jgi:N-acetylglutamate synthase-like GNAT family acetyltransferase
MSDLIEVTSDKSKIDMSILIEFLNKDSYWAKDRSIDVIQKSINNSKCYSLLVNGKFIGFARIVTDFCTFAYLCDVFIIKQFQHKKYGEQLINKIINDKELNGIFIYLLTRDAHGFYNKFGFKVDENLQKKLMCRRILL